MNRRGQVLPVVLLSFVFLTTTSLYVLATSDTLDKKIATQAISDATSLSAARVQAKALNQIVVMNKGIKVLKRERDAIVAAGVVLTVCCVARCYATYVGCTCASNVKKYASDSRSHIKDLIKLANRMAKVQDNIASRTPYFTYSALYFIPRENGLSGLPARWSTPDNPIAMYLPPKLLVQREGDEGISNVSKCEKIPQSEGTAPVEPQTICKNAEDVYGGESFTFPGYMTLADDFKEKQRIAVHISHVEQQNIITPNLRKFFRNHFDKNNPVANGRAQEHFHPENQLDDISFKAISEASPVRTDGEETEELMDAVWDAELKKVTMLKKFPEYIIDDFKDTLHH